MNRFGQFRDKFGINKGAIATLDRQDVPPDVSLYVYKETLIK